MAKYYLEIKLISPLTSAVGEGRVGLVDTDITFDDLGLPILLGRRLKGLWREAYADVVDAWKQCGKIPTPVDDIFGKPGQKPNDGSACFYIGNAELKDVLEADAIKTWLEYLQFQGGHRKAIILVDDVVDFYTTVRTQTAIDRLTGAAQENTLRLTRTLESGWVFRAPMHFNEPPNTQLKNALALSALALRYMGTARTRGLGKVQCCFIKENNGHINCLKPDLTQSELPSITGADTIHSSVAEVETIPSEQQPDKETTCDVNLNTDTPTHVLRYRLTLKEPVVVPVADGDPNTVVTRQDIPGAHLWGTAAWHYLKDPKHAPQDASFRTTFLDGGLRFLTAYPEVHDQDNSDDPDQRTIPIPHSIREVKDEDRQLLDFTESLDDKQKMQPKKRIGSRYARIYKKELKTTTVDTELNYHHARVPDDRSIGRAKEGVGSIFKYEAIVPGKSFQGAVLGTENCLNNLKELLTDINTIRLGRSQSAQYGHAEFNWIDDDPLDINKRIEWDGFIDMARKGDAPPLPPDNRLIITTLSPVLSVNENGHPDIRFPVHELVSMLELKNKDKLELTTSYTRTEMLSGYSTHLRLPRQQHPVIAAGSVFEFELKQELSEKGKKGLATLEQDGIGLRKGEGYGRVAVNRQHDLGLTGEVEQPIEKTHIDKPSEKVPEEIQMLLEGIVETRCISEMEKHARHIVDQLLKNNDIPNNTLLGRLRHFIQEDEAALAKNLNELRKKPAEEKLQKCRIDKGGLTDFKLPDQLSLFSLFMTAGEDPKKFTEKLIETYVKTTIAIDCDDETQEKMVNSLLNERSWSMGKHFLDYLITALRRKT